MLAARYLIQRRGAVRHVAAGAAKALATDSVVSNPRCSGVHGENSPKDGASTAVLMEPNTLCQSIVQAARDGRVNKRTWKMHLQRAIQLKNQLSLKHIAIIVHSCSNAKIDRTQLYALLDSLADSIMMHLSRGNSAVRVVENSGIELYNIYSILHGALASGYNNAEMLNMLKDTAVTQFRAMLRQDASQALVPFVFEDLAGIAHALTQMQVPIDRADVETVADLFTNLYMRDRNGAGTITNRTFAIIFNALERLGCHTVQLYHLGAEYMQQHIKSMHNIKDMAMLYCSLVKVYSGVCSRDAAGWQGSIKQAIEDPPSVIGATTVVDSGYIDTMVNSGPVQITTKDLARVSGYSAPCTDDIASITTMLLERLLEPGIVVGSVDIDAQSVANIVAYGASYAEIGDDRLKELYNTVMGHAVARIMQTTDVDYRSLIYIMKHAIRINRMDDAILMLTAHNVHNVGRLAGPLEFAQHVMNIKSIHDKFRGTKLTSMLLSIAVTNMMHFDKRLAMPLLTVKQRPQRRRTLRDLINAADRKDVESDTISVHNDLYNYFKGENAFHCCSKALAAISEFNGHKAAVDLAHRLVDIMTRLCHTEDYNVDMESIAAASTALCRFRLKNELILRSMASKVTLLIHTTPYVHTVVQILLAYAKFGCPLNRDINRGLIASPGIKRLGRSKLYQNAQQPYQEMFIKALRAFTARDVITRMNAQTMVNCIFAIAISGMGERVPLTLYRLLDRLVDVYRNPDTCVEMEKQLKTSLIVLKQVCKRRYRLLRQKIKRLQRIERKVISGETVSVPKEQITVNPMKPYSTLSGLHREVWRSIKKKHTDVTVKSEVLCKNGLYCTDIVVQRGITKIHIEVDGPTHFFHATQEPMPTSKLKHAILKAYGSRIVHAPYYGWKKNMTLIKI